MVASCLNYSGRFPRGVPKRGNPTMTTSTVKARRKRNPQHYVEGMNPRGVSEGLADKNGTWSHVGATWSILSPMLALA